MADLFTKEGHTKTTSTVEPWDVQIPYLTAGFDAAEQMFLQDPGPAYFPHSTVAGFSPDQVASQNMIRETALGGSPVMDAANQYALDVLGGQYQDPYSDPVFANIRSHVMPAINSQYMMQGRLPTQGQGGNAYVDAMTRGLTEAYAPWASQNWQFGQKQMSDMAKFAPDLRKMDYFDAGALGLVGKEQQDLANKELADAQARWDYYQNLPQQKLANYMGMIGGQSWGGTTTTRAPQTKPTDAGEILGGALGILGGIGDIFGGSIF